MRAFDDDRYGAENTRRYEQIYAEKEAKNMARIQAMRTVLTAMRPDRRLESVNNSVWDKAWAVVDEVDEFEIISSFDTDGVISCSPQRVEYLESVIIELKSHYSDLIVAATVCMILFINVIIISRFRYTAGLRHHLLFPTRMLLVPLAISCTILCIGNQMPLSALQTAMHRSLTSLSIMWALFWFENVAILCVCDTLSFMGILTFISDENDVKKDSALENFFK